MTAPMRRMKVRLGDLLVDKKLISEAQLQEALAEQKRSGRKIGQVLIENGYIQEELMLQTLSAQLKVPYVDISTFELNPELVKRLPETAARRYRSLVLKETPDGLLVAMGDPTDIFGYDEIVRILKRPVLLAMARESDLLQNIDRMYQQGDQLQTLASEVGRELSDNTFDLEKLIAISDQSDAPVVRLIQSVFESAVSANASDIHVEPGEDSLRIRRRIDGVLHEQVVDDKRITNAMVSRLKLMAEADISERRLPQDGRFSVNVKNKRIDVRLSTINTQHGESVVMRLLDHGSAVRQLEQLGMPDELLSSFRQIIHKPHGLILVTGPTGSGKTTTLYAALNELNTPQKKIITIEDPVEYRLPRLNQVQVNNKIGLSFARVLRTSLRLDPDIILIGEMRDQETGEIGLRAALTGHLVMSTLHTNDAISSASRLIDMGLEGYLVASSVQAILAQRLIRRVCPNCSSAAPPDSNELAWLHSHMSASLD
ncbi:MAG: Flp pilus assembly complex ATPase component TadA, partial [Halobacteria archaeon]|nr:Flp pilus assembly complex ATPase component TadA [Halobacteria archaeon]